MRVLAVISFTISAAIFTYLIGATLGSPVGQVVVDVTTVIPDAQRDDVDATTFRVFADEAVTGESVTSRARQEGEDDDDDNEDTSTVGPVVVVSTHAPVPPPAYNESTVVREFNYIAQPVNVPAAVAVPVVEGVDDDATVSPQRASGDEDESENEISQDQVVTTVQPSFISVDSEYKVDPEANRNAEQEEAEHDDNGETTPLIPSSNSSEEFQGQGRAGCECGKLPFKIPVNEESRINPSPWLVAIVRGGLFAGGRPHCAGTLINNLYVLTSASCMEGLYASSIQVWLTAHDSFEHHQASFGNVKLNVQEITKHPNYDRRTKDNDLCLLKLSAGVDISGKSYFVPACLPAGNQYDFAGTTAKISGWSDGRANKMCKAEMPILDNKICNRDSKHHGKITANMVCAGFLTPTRLETCIGDAGGPLVSPNEGRATLVGIVSWGFESRNKDYSPTVYSRVSEFSDWILHNTRDADWCGI